MNQPNSSMQAPNGQIPNTQQQQQQQTPQQQQQQVNLGHPNDVPNVNWRAEVSDADRNRFVSQLSLALKHLSPATSDNETYNVASNFEAGLYQRCTSKNQYILAYAKKFQHIREQINQNNGNINNFQQQPMSPLAGVNNAQSPQLQRNNFQSPLNLNQQQQQVMPTQNTQMRPQSNFNMVQQGRPPQNQLQQQQQQGTPIQSPAQTQAQAQIQAQAQAQAQMLAQQRSAAAAAMAMSNNPQLMSRPQQQQQNQIPLNLLQNMNTSNAAQAGLNISPQQFQMYFARQMALQQQQQQQQQQGQPAQQQLQNQLLQQQIQQQQQQQQNYSANNLGMAQQQMLNMGGNNFRPQQQQQQQPTSQETTQDSPLQQNSTVNYNPGSMSASSTPITVPVTLASVQQQQQQKMQQPFNIRPPQPNSQQAQQMVNQELLMQRLQQQQQQQQQQQNLMDGAMAGQQRPPLQQTPQQFVQQGMYNQGMQRPMLNAQQMQQQPQNMNFKPLTSIQRNNAAAIVKQMDEGVRQGRVRAPVIDNLSENDKIAIREQMGLMRTMYDKIDNLLPIFLAMTNNSEATRRLILMKYMFEDQLVALNHNKFLISLENLNKLREQFNGYFTWVRNAVGQHHQQQMMANMNNGGIQNPLMNQQQQIGLGLMPMHMPPQQPQQQPQQSMSPQTMQGSPVVNYNMMNQQNLMAQQGMMAPQGMNPAQSQAQAFAMLQRQAQQQAQQQQNTPQQAHVQLPQQQQGQSPSLQNQQTQQQQQQQQSQENVQEAATTTSATAAPTASVPPASVENTPVMSNTQANTTPAPTTPTAGMKRGSIDLRLPMTKKQRGSKSSASSQSPTLSRKNQKANADKEKTVGTPASAPASTTLSQQPPPQNQEMTSLSASNSPAMMNNNGQPMSAQMGAQQMENNPNFNMQYNGGIPVRAGMPLNQHQAQSQAFYMAAVNNGIPPQIVSLLPPKALQFNWFLQQAAQKKMNLSPQQQQQLQGMLNDHIEVAKQQLMQQSSSSSASVHQQRSASITTPASILMNQVSNNGFDMTQQQQQLSLQQQQQQLYQQHMQQQALQHHQMQQQLQHQMNQKSNQTQDQENKETSVKQEEDTIKIKQEQQHDTKDSKDNIPKSSPKADNQDLNPQGDEDVMSSIYFSNVVLKDMMDEKNPNMTPQQYHPQQAPPPPTQQQQQQQAPPQQQQNTSFDGFSGALKEGYKDETFGTPDLSLLTKPSAVKEEEGLVETGDLQSSWYDSAGGMDIGMDVFDWDNNDFVEFGDNDGALPSTSNESSKKNNNGEEDSSSKKDDKKLIDESNKAIAVSL